MMLLGIFEGFAFAAGPLTSPAAQQIGGPAACCSLEAVDANLRSLLSCSQVNLN
jgi:hypothetical protein